MREDAVFIPGNVYGENLRILDERQIALGELRISEMAELAREASETTASMVRDGFLPYEAMSALSLSELLGQRGTEADVMPQSRHLISRLKNSLSAADKAIFSSLYEKGCRQRGYAFSLSDFFDKNEDNETFTYVKNTLADEAYDVFSQDFSDPHVFYSGSFKEAVFDLIRGKVGYAILPIEEGGGVRLGSIESIIFENALKIAAVTPVFGFEGNADMKYALVSPSLSAPSFSVEDEVYVELRFSVSDELSLSELLQASELLSLSPYKVRTSSFRGENGEMRDYFSVILKDEDHGLIPLLVYLNLFYPDCEVVGVYKNME